MPGPFRYDDVTLPSGWRLRGIRPSTDELIRRGIYPAELRAAVARIDQRAGNEAASDADLQTLVEHTHIVIAGYIRQVFDEALGDWRRQTYTPEDVHEFIPEDLDALEDIILRRRTPDQVNRGVSLADAQREEAGDTVEAWAGFRDDSRGADAGDDGGDVASTSVDVARSGRPGRRARAGRGPGDAASLGA